MTFYVSLSLKEEKRISTCILATSDVGWFYTSSVRGLTYDGTRVGKETER